MATLYVNYMPNCDASSADAAEALTTSTTTATGTKTTKGNSEIELFSTAAHWVSVGSAPNAQTDPGRFLVFPSFPKRVKTTKGMKIAAATA